MVLLTWFYFTCIAGHFGFRFCPKGSRTAQTEALWEEKEPCSLPYTG